MIVIGVFLIIIGVLTMSFGALQNTILYNIFAPLNERLARANSEVDFSFAWIFAETGLLTLIIGAIILIAGIVLIVLKKKRSK